jgi:hypothetical protein
VPYSAFNARISRSAILYVQPDQNQIFGCNLQFIFAKLRGMMMVLVFGKRQSFQTIAAICSVAAAHVV